VSKSNARQRIAIVTKIPADLAQALDAIHDCFSHDFAIGSIIPDISVAVTTSMAGADAALFDSLPDLRLLVCQGAGLDRIDLVAAKHRNIIVAHTPDILTVDVAEFAIALMMASVRRVVEADQFVREGQWSAERMAPATRLSGKVVGVVGLGKIGKAVAERAEGLGMSVVWHGPHPKPDIKWDYEPSLIGLAAQCDVMILTVPGGAATRRIVDGAVLAALGPSGWLINVARGSVVDENALIDALSTGAIAGAGLDVYVQEPAIDPRFHIMDNVVLAPHYASITKEARKEIITLILSNIENLTAGRPIQNAAA
jgi:hydroxypyruvate reductase